MSDDNITSPADQIAEGDRYYNGDGIEKDFTQAVYWYKKAAAQGYAQGEYYLGYCYFEGEGIEKDIKQAVHWYTKAAAQGNAAAQQKLGICYYQGDGVDQDYVKAAELFKESAQQGRAFAQFLLGHCYYNGQGLKQDYAQSAKWLMKSADQNDDSAQCLLGYSFYYGNGFEKDSKKAVDWWTKAAQQDNFDAQYCLGDCYLEGEGVEEDHEKAAYWYAKAAEQGHAQAQFKLAYRYLKGDGVECDTEKAIYWYTKSADQGFVNAQYSLGVCYENGEGTEKDSEKAMYWYTKAAEQGHADSCLELAIMYFDSENSFNNYEKGMYWFREGAKTEDLRMMLHFGQSILEKENIMAEEKNEGLGWIEKAADNNEHDNEEIIWQARWVLAEIYEYGLYNITKDLNKARHYYELLVENGDKSAAVYAKLLNQGKEDPYASIGWNNKNLVSKILMEDFPEFDAEGTLYEMDKEFSDVEFSEDEKEACMPIAKKILEYADLVKRESVLALAEKAQNEEDLYFKTALKLAADGIRVDLFDEVFRVLFRKDISTDEDFLKWIVIHRGIYLIIKGNITTQKLKVLLGMPHLPRLLADKPLEREYKMTFNYLLTHREIPKLYFEDLNTFYKKVLPDPDMIQRFLTYAYGRSKFFAIENPEIEPPYDIENFDIYLYEEEKGRSVIVITLPVWDKAPDSYQIAIPTERRFAGYYTCELSVDPLLNEPCFIFGEWDKEMKHQNYGKIKMTSDSSFAKMAVEIAFGKPLEKPPFDRKNMVFDKPSHELYCEECETTNFFYSDNKPPYYCDCCGTELHE